MGTYGFKKFNYYSPEPKAIDRLVFNPVLYKLAVSRSGNILEIWDVKHTPHIDRVIIIDENDTVESVIWCGDRLFTSGIAGSVLEYDILNLSVKQELPIISGICWCIAVSSDNTCLAAGTEDGYVNIIRIEDGILMHEKLLDKQQGRILCIAWEQNGDFLTTGSVDAVRVWNVRTGHAVHKLTPGRLEVHKPTVVWCITVTSDFTIISGDSRGIITFWDGYQGLHIDSHQSHEADILAVCLDNSQSKLYCAGMDPLIASFEKINVRGSGNADLVNYKWIKSIQRVIHDHAVKALTMCDEKLFSGGLDGYLALSTYPPKVLIKYSPMLQSRRVCLAAEAKIILITYDEHLEVWHWSPKATLTHVAMIKSYKNKNIRCSSISSDGTWIVYSTENVFRLLRFCWVKNSNSTEIKRISGLPPELKSAVISFCFSPNNEYLVVANKNKTIIVVELQSDENVRLLSVLNTDGAVLEDLIHLISISDDGRFIVTADRMSNIAVWKDYKYYCALPKYNNCSPTAMAINNSQQCVVVSYADHKIVEFSLVKKKYTTFSRTLDQRHPKQWLSRQFPVEGILFDRNNPDVIIIYDDSTICIIDKTKKLPDVSRKIPRLDTVKSPEHSDNSESSSSLISLNKSDNIAFHVLKEFKHLVYLTTFSENELLVVEVNPDTLTKNLPTVFLKKRFGTM